MHSLLMALVFTPKLAVAEPVARAGRTFLAYPEESIRLDGSTSRGTDLEYRWVQIGGPSVALKDAATARPSFSPKQPGRYTFELTVREGDITSAPDAVETVVLDPELGTRYVEKAGCGHAPRFGAGPVWIGLVALGVSSRRRRDRHPA